MHSCLLVETDDRVGLFDPGSFSWQSGLVKVEALERVDRIIITHEHADHYDPDFLRAVLARFEQAHIVCNDSVRRKIEADGISGLFRGQETQCTKPFEAPHETLPVLSVEPPANTGFHFQNLLSHPGDSHRFTETKKVLALPVTAPWGSTTDAVRLALELKPEYVIPIHDWHYRDEARAGMYDMLERAFAESSIKFLKPQDGVAIEI